jgi:hypothetical protein
MPRMSAQHNSPASTGPHARDDIALLIARTTR